MFTKIKPTKNKNLVISRVGDTSLHRQWMDPVSFKNFDLLLSYYGDHARVYEKDCEIYHIKKGSKYPIIKEIILELGHIIYSYDAIWIPDDDISTNAYNISQMFDLFKHQKLILAQPALTINSYINWPMTTQNLDSILRYTDFIENMAPIFSIGALKKCQGTFGENKTGWGIDTVWSKLLGYPKDKIAILDITPVKHSRKTFTGDLYKNINELYNRNIDDGKEEWLDVLRKYEIDPNELHWETTEGIPIVNGNSLEHYKELIETDKINSRKMRTLKNIIKNRKRKKKMGKVKKKKKTSKMNKQTKVQVINKRIKKGKPRKNGVLKRKTSNSIRKHNRKTL